MEHPGKLLLDLDGPTLTLSHCVLIQGLNHSPSTMEISFP